MKGEMMNRKSSLANGERQDDDESVEMFSLQFEDVFPYGIPVPLYFEEEDCVDLDRFEREDDRRTKASAGDKSNRSSSNDRGRSASSNPAGDKQEQNSRPWREMEGPSFHCAYLGFSTISKPPTSMGVLQTPVRDMYYKYRKSPNSARAANVRLTQRGVLLLLYGEGGVVKSELFFDFGAVVFVETARFSPVKSSSERKPKAIFLPVEHEGGGARGSGGGAHAAQTDKHAFPVDKSAHFLVTSAHHPPLVVCVVRRPQGVKALDCHVMALDTLENALHIGSIIGSASQPGPVSQAHRVGANFDKSRNAGAGGAGGDVIRTEYGEYSVYRGGHVPPGYDGGGGVGPPPQHRHSGMASGGGGASGPPAGRNGYLSGGLQGGIVLTQDNFLSDSVTDPQYPPSQYQHGPPPGGYLKGAGMYTPPTHAVGPHGYHNHPPDVIMHASRPLSGDGGSENGYFHTPTHDRSFGSSAMGGAELAEAVRMRHEESGGVAGSRHSGSRFSSGGQNSPRGSGEYPAHTGAEGVRRSYLPPGARPMFPPPAVARSPQTPPQGETPVRPSMYGPPVQSPPPTSPRTHEAFRPPPARDEMSREIFSASNRESRAIEEDEDDDSHSNMSGKPVAKVPPHYKAGIKVLPSDFRMVKLKHNEPKSPQSPGYDNNKGVMDKYRELQEAERHSYPDVAASTQLAPGRAGFNNNYGNTQVDDNFRDFRSDMGNDLRDDRNRDFRSRWEDSTESPRQGPSSGDFYHQPQHGQSAAANKSHTSYNVGREDNQHDAPSNDQARFKDLEIASMFANVRLDGGSSTSSSNVNNNNGYGMRKGDYLPQTNTQKDFEYGLGYLP